jgi:hypothetical protein
LIENSNRNTEVAIEEMHETTTNQEIWTVHEELLQVHKDTQLRGSVAIRSGLTVELKQYLDQPHLPRKRSNQILDSNEDGVSCSIYCRTKYPPIVGTSVPCQRLFSKAEVVLREKSSRLTSKRLSSLIFLSSLEDRYWFDQ